MKENVEPRRGGEVGREGVGTTSDADLERQERPMREGEKGERARTRKVRYHSLDPHPGLETVRKEDLTD